MSIDWNKVEWRTTSRGSAANESGPAITINKSGRIVFNDEALQVMGGKVEACRVGVMFNQRKRATLVIQSWPRGEDGSLALTTIAKKQTLNTTKFLTDKGLKDFFGKSYVGPTYDEKEAAFIIPLDKAE